MAFGDVDFVEVFEGIGVVSKRPNLKILQTTNLTNVSSQFCSVLGNRQRQALIDAAEIAGFRVKLLAHETSAAALQRSLDFDPVEPEKQLIFNMGARKTEVCVAEFHQRAAGMVMRIVGF